MKLFKLLLLFAILSTITACGDDDDCVQADWVGVYTGTVVCTEDGVVLDTEDVTVTISAEGSDQISIVYVTPITGLDTDAIDFNGCNVTSSGEDLGVTISVVADLDGDDLVLTDNLTSAMFSSSCVVNATRN